METLLFGVTATDPVTFAVVALVLIFAALAACVHSRRGARRKSIPWWRSDTSEEVDMLQLVAVM